MKKKLITILNEFENYVGAALLLAMLIMLTLQVVSRYVFKHSFTWTEELSTIMFVWLVYLGCSAAVLKGQHLRIDLLLNAFKGKTKKALLILTDLITMVFCGVMIPYLLNVIGNLAARHSTTMLLKIPQNVVYSIIPFALVMTIIRFVQEIIIVIKTPEHEQIGIVGKTIFDELDGKTQPGQEDKT